jgi:hypothetical protein
MTTRRTFLKAAVGVVGGAGLLVVLGVLLAPRWINLALVRARIEAVASSGLGGTVRYERIDLSWFPRPGVVVRKVELSAPGKAQGTVRAVSFSPALPALLDGRVRITRVVVDGLDLSVEIEGSSAKEESASPQDPLQVLRSLVPEGRSLAVELHEGQALITRQGTTLATVSGLDVETALSSEGGNAIHAELTLSARAISVRRDARRSLAIDGLRLEGGVDSGAGSTQIKLSHLSVKSPRILLTANLRTGGKVPGAELTASGSDLDVTGFRKKLLPFAEDVPALAAVLGILRGGTLPSFSFAARGETPGDLGVFERMSIRASLAGGSLSIVGAGLAFEEARGDVSIQGGVLSAANVSAEVGKSKARDGIVLVGLTRNDDRLRVEANVRANLAELPGILSRTLQDRSLLEELSMIEDLEGTASGRIAIDGRTTAMNTNVSVSEMRFSGRTRRIPWPVRVDRGSFSFDGKRIGLGRLTGNIGPSTFSDFATRVRLETSPVIERLSGNFEASLAEIFSEVVSRDAMEPLRTTVRQLKGNAKLSVARLSGPLLEPKEWRVEAKGTFGNFLLDATFLPGPLEVSSGGIEVDAETIRLTRLEARTKDAVFQASATIGGYRERARTIEATADGEVGAEGVRRVWERAALPKELLPRAPVTLAGVRVRIAGPKEFSLAGTFTAAGGPRVTLDLATSKNGIEISNLTVADGKALATMSFRQQEEAVQIGFKGRLDGSTLARLFERQLRGRGRIEGDFRALLPKGHLGPVVTEGTLSVAGLHVPTPAGELSIERFDVRGAKNRLEVVSSSLVLDEQRFSVSGSAEARRSGIDVDADVSTGDLAWPTIEKVVDRLKKPIEPPSAAMPSGVVAPAPATTAAPAAPRFALGGDIRVSLDSFGFRKFTWKPVLLDVRLEGDSTTATVRKAEICGISTTGKARILPGGTMAVDVAVDAAGPNINVPLACLGLGEARMTGRYEASLRAEATGEASQLLRAAHGPLTFKATEGSLGKVSVLTRILGVLNATDVFAGKDGSRVGKAMPFRELSVAAALGDGAVLIEEGTLSTPSFTMAASGRIGTLDGSLDLMVLSQPLSTLDKVVQAVPVVRDVLGKDFLSVAAKVTGNLDDPKVRISPAKDVGKGLVNILERTVKLPVKVFDPAPPAQRPPMKEPPAAPNSDGPG